MYKRTIRRHSYWEERDPYHVASLFIGGAQLEDLGQWLGFCGVI